MRAPATGLRGPSSAALASTRRTLPSGAMADAAYCAPGLAKLPVSTHSQLLEVADERRVQAHLHAEVLEHGDAGGRARCSRAAARTSASSTPAIAAYPAMSTSARAVTTSSAPVVCSATQARSTRPSSTTDGGERGEQPGVGAGPHLQVDVGELGGLGAPRIDDDHRPGRVAGDLLQRRAGAREAVATATGSCRRTRRPRRARSRRARWCRTCWALTQNSPVFSWARALER